MQLMSIEDRVRGGKVACEVFSLIVGAWNDFKTDDERTRFQEVLRERLEPVILPPVKKPSADVAPMTDEEVVRFDMARFNFTVADFGKPVKDVRRRRLAVWLDNTFPFAQMLRRYLANPEVRRQMEMEDR